MDLLWPWHCQENSTTASQSAILGPRSGGTCCTQEFSHASQYTSTDGKLWSFISHVSGSRAALKISAPSSQKYFQELHHLSSTFIIEEIRRDITSSAPDFCFYSNSQIILFTIHKGNLIFLLCNFLIWTE